MPQRGGTGLLSGGGGGGLYPQPPDRVPLGWDGLDTHPYPVASVTYSIDALEGNQNLESGRAPPQRATRGGASFAEGRARSPSRPIRARGSGWEAGPPCLLGAGSKAWGGLPIARLKNPSRVELQSNPSGGALDTCNQVWGRRYYHAQTPIL